MSWLGLAESVVVVSWPAFPAEAPLVKEEMSVTILEFVDVLERGTAGDSSSGKPIHRSPFVESVQRVYEMS